jgi:glutamyl-tRNA synthetase
MTDAPSPAPPPAGDDGDDGDEVTYVGRYAPSPTGDLHLGNVFAAVCAWARARQAGGRCLLRIEDLDQQRCVAGAAEQMEEDLFRLGLEFDAGPHHDDGRGPYVQSACLDRYAEALRALRDAGHLFACRCSRKELRAIASAPHEGEEGPPYPGTCRHLGLPFDDPALLVAWRFIVAEGTVGFLDWLQGPQQQDVQRVVGDFVVRRKDDVVAYHLAVVVDDAYQGVTEVVRGRDLMSSSARQILLCRALDLPVPRYAHVPLLVDEEGRRLSKRRGDATLRAWLDKGVPATVILGWVGAAAGVCRDGDELDAQQLAELLTPDVLRSEHIVVPGH